MYIKFFKTVCPFNIVYTKLRHETLKVCRPALSYVLHIYAGSVRRGQLSDNERKSIFIENFPKKKKAPNRNKAQSEAREHFFVSSNEGESV